MVVMLYLLHLQLQGKGESLLILVIDEVISLSMNRDQILVNFGYLVQMRSLILYQGFFFVESFLGSM
uniref:Uncharacterized protein n=1 Tax=Manihot esculenta TaxID=3983 RepID=A0A2C9UEZ9_MANES